ncbi:MAG: TraR/DksA C4-type zinc finger protein [Actinomycetota bacterium]|nr:TraR/DksA C4-type zinc finger protein [Actinomycetota bacterium]
MSTMEQSSPDEPRKDGWTAAELRKVRKSLELEVARLKADIAVASREYGSNLGDILDGTGDEVVDVGSLMVELREGSTVASNEIDILTQCERALERIRTKTYGTCEDCRAPIAKDRLMALPRATLCMTCQQDRVSR